MGVLKTFTDELRRVQAERETQDLLEVLRRKIDVLTFGDLAGLITSALGKKLAAVKVSALFGVSADLDGSPSKASPASTPATATTTPSKKTARSVTRKKAARKSKVKAKAASKRKAQTRKKTAAQGAGPRSSRSSEPPSPAGASSPSTAATDA